MTWYQFLLFLHIAVAVIAFGATFAFPFLGNMGGKEPQHVNFALRVTLAIEEKLTTPLAVVMPFLGLLLIRAGHHDLWRSEWLLIAIPLYTAAFFFALFVQSPKVKKLVEMTGGAHAPAGGPAPVSGAQQGPPPEMLRLIQQTKMGGMFLSLAVLGLVLLMVWKPGASYLLGS